MPGWEFLFPPPPLEAGRAETKLTIEDPNLDLSWISDGTDIEFTANNLTHPNTTDLETFNYTIHEDPSILDRYNVTVWDERENGTEALDAYAFNKTTRESPNGTKVGFFITETALKLGYAWLNGLNFTLVGILDDYTFHNDTRDLYYHFDDATGQLLVACRDTEGWPCESDDDSIRQRNTVEKPEGIVPNPDAVWKYSPILDPTCTPTTLWKRTDFRSGGEDNANWLALYFGSPEGRDGGISGHPDYLWELRTSWKIGTTSSTLGADEFAVQSTAAEDHDEDGTVDDHDTKHSDMVNENREANRCGWPTLEYSKHPPGEGIVWDYRLHVIHLEKQETNCEVTVSNYESWEVKAIATALYVFETAGGDVDDTIKKKWGKDHSESCGEGDLWIDAEVVMDNPPTSFILK